MLIALGGAIILGAAWELYNDWDNVVEWSEAALEGASRGMAQSAGMSDPMGFLNGVPPTAPMPPDPKDSQRNKGINGKGWEGDKGWRDAVADAKKGGDFDTGKHGVPSETEARRLLDKAGAVIDRVEDAHGPDSVSRHNYPHINYHTADGTKGTMEIRR